MSGKCSQQDGSEAKSGADAHQHPALTEIGGILPLREVKPVEYQRETIPDGPFERLNFLTNADLATTAQTENANRQLERTTTFKTE